MRAAPYRRRHLAALREVMPSDVDDYVDLHPLALALTSTAGAAARPVVRLLLPTISQRALFAGSRTAIVFAARLAELSGTALEICHFEAPLSRQQQRAIVTLVAGTAGLEEAQVRVRSVWTATPTNDRDLYIATFWTTAMATQIAERLGTVSRDRVLYLVQDYEPEFYAGSTESALCRSTYHAGFRMVVNSKPLATYLGDREELRDRITHVFRPELDLAGLAAAAAARTRASTARVAFYGRPSNPRNSFHLGVASLRVAARKLRDAGIRADFVSVGEQHADIQAPGTRIRSLGKLSWDGYFEFLGRTDVMLSFQQTPHPSHPPLDAVASGTFAVTNEMAGSRTGLSPRLLVSEADPAAVADRIVEAAERALGGERTEQLDEAFIARLGTPLAEVTQEVFDAIA